MSILLVGAWPLMTEECHVDEPALGPAVTIMLTGSERSRLRADVDYRLEREGRRLRDQAPHAAAAGGAGDRERPRRDVRRGQLDRAPLPAVSGCGHHRKRHVEGGGGRGRGRHGPGGPASQGRRGVERRDGRLSRDDPGRRRQVGRDQGRARRSRQRSSRSATATARMRPTPIGRRQSPASTFRPRSPPPRCGRT